ncbi:hypothetical protein [uncultured Ruthenibacterium sp.]
MKIYREIPTDANSLVSHEQIMDEITLAIAGYKVALKLSGSWTPS